MTDKPNTYVGLDISGSQTRSMVAVGQGPRLRYLSHGALPLARWNDTDHRDLQATPEAVYHAIIRAEREGGLTIASAVVGLSGASVVSRLVHAVATLPAGRQIVADSDIGNALRLCSRAVTSGDWTVLQLVPQEFAAGAQGRVRNPLGLPAARLEAFARVIAMHREEHDRAARSVNQASVSVEETVLGGFAAAYGTLSESECAKGVAHLDFGKSASSLTAFCGGALRMATGIPVGRDQLVSDVARAFNTGKNVASSLVSDFGDVDQDQAQSTAFVMVPSVNTPQGNDLGRPWPLRTLNRVIGLCLEKCLALALEELRRDGLMRAGVQSLVLTGDIAVLPGVRELAQSVIGLRTRIGVPCEPEGLPQELRSPSWACAAGLVRYAYRLAVNSRSQKIVAMKQQEVSFDRTEINNHGIGWSRSRRGTQLHT